MKGGKKRNFRTCGLTWHGEVPKLRPPLIIDGSSYHTPPSTMVSNTFTDHVSIWMLQSNVLRPYLAAVRSTLTAALTLEDFSSQVRLAIDNVTSSMLIWSDCRAPQQARDRDKVCVSNLFLHTGFTSSQGIEGSATEPSCNLSKWERMRSDWAFG